MSKKVVYIRDIFIKQILLAVDGKQTPEESADQITNALADEGWGTMVKCPNFHPGCGEDDGCFIVGQCTDDVEPKIFAPLMKTGKEVK